MLEWSKLSLSCSIPMREWYVRKMRESEEKCREGGGGGC